MTFSFLLQKELPPVPAITYQHNWSDDADQMRWRAYWDKSYYGEIRGVIVKPYPVIKTTPQGAWIDPLAYWHGVWNLSDKALHKWVSNDGGQAWAKPTRQIAIDSLIYRHKRWSSRILNDIIYFRNVTNALGALFPQEARHVAQALKALEFTAKTGER